MDPRSINRISTPRLFISYKREAEPDSAIAHEVAEALAGAYKVFIDSTIHGGEKWGPRIEEELSQSDIFVPLLSPVSV